MLFCTNCVGFSLRRDGDPKKIKQQVFQPNFNVFVSNHNTNTNTISVLFSEQRVV